MGSELKTVGVTVVLLILLIPGSGCLEDGINPDPRADSGNEVHPAAGEPEAGQSKLQLSTLVAVYMVGSDLESESGYASRDIFEILDGAALGMEGAEVVLAYGGADLKGWKGMTIADLEDLERDGGDGVIGNEAFHRKVYRYANMGDSDSLETFLSYIRDNYESEKVLLIFWDHGDAYRGVCFDENRGYDRLELSEIESALEGSGMHFDIIGFDACLMASLELAKAIKNSGDYMLASETIEPTHGWDYTALVGYVGGHPGASPEDIGKVVIDSYLENQEHVPPRTLSLLDLSRTDSVLESVDLLVAGLDPKVANSRSYCGLGASFTKARKFGAEPRQEAEISMDLQSFALGVREEIPELAGNADALLAELEEFVVYKRQDGTVPGSYGVSVYSPQASESYYRDYGKVSLSEAWYGFLGGYMERTCADFTDPEISKSGNSFAVEDDSGLASVEQVYFMNSSGGMALLGKTPVGCSEEGSYGLPAWDGKWVYLQDPGTGEASLVYATCGGETEDGERILTTELGLLRNGRFRPCLGHFYLDPQKGTLKAYMNPYEVLKAGDVLFSREVLELKAGDSVTSYAPLYGEGGVRQWTELGTITVGKDAAFVYDYLPEGTYYTALYAEDYRSNFNISEPVELVLD
ncbi:hypothetical protein FTO70_00740 [Methanosarcina sp. KYL-1]|uniref:clostripain-related cysteine peptidase n=1 Tax=Methanosarcina sp. KYL-1 TaxID=2602068 RepID=UPI0021015CE8|nr:clostripain-related cysteine peptidase [Methanosarcina sp. KYL-1]MCQ1534245.1 hypothetical protein [Methanosarcina sp. KYL-1]